MCCYRMNACPKVYENVRGVRGEAHLGRRSVPSVCRLVCQSASARAARAHARPPARPSAATSEDSCEQRAIVTHVEAEMCVRTRTSGFTVYAIVLGY